MKIKLFTGLLLIALASMAGTVSFVYLNFLKADQQRSQELLLTRAQNLKELLIQKSQVAESLNKTMYDKWKEEPAKAQELLDDDDGTLLYSVVRIDLKGDSRYLDLLLNKRLQHSPIYDINRLKTLPARILVNQREIQEKEILTVPSGFLTGSPSLLQIMKHPNGHYSALILDISQLAAQLSTDKYFDNVIIHQNGKAFIGSKTLEKDNVTKILESTLPMNSIKVQSPGGLLHQSYAKDESRGIVGVGSLRDEDLTSSYQNILKRSAALGVAGISALFLFLFLVLAGWEKVLSMLLGKLEKIADGKFLKEQLDAPGELNRLAGAISQLSQLMQQTIDSKLRQEVSHKMDQHKSAIKKEVASLLRPSPPEKSEIAEMAGSLIITSIEKGLYCDHIQRDGNHLIIQFHYNGGLEESMVALGHVKSAVGLFKNLPNMTMDKCVSLLRQSLSSSNLDSEKIKLLMAILDKNSGKIFILNCGMPRSFVGDFTNPQNLRALQMPEDKFFSIDSGVSHQLQAISATPNQVFLFPMFLSEGQAEEKLFLQSFLKAFQNYQNLSLSNSSLEKGLVEARKKSNLTDSTGYSILTVISQA